MDEGTKTLVDHVGKMSPEINFYIEEKRRQ